ncbi:hypothetical protein GGR52DRAFT_527968 [Hypoxylon sp. FL1284]|nr:hypothetical protein GGR52DRAFT_527968 [Hypoxylon sp. FL1284]
MAMAISGESNAGKLEFHTTVVSCTLDVQVYPFEVKMEAGMSSAARHPGAGATRSIHGGLLDYMWRSYPNPSRIYPDNRWIGDGILGSLVTGDVMEANVTRFFDTDLIPFKVGGWLLKGGPLYGFELVDPSTLKEVMRLYHSVYGSLVAHYSFRIPAQDSTSAVITQNLSRLGMQRVISQIMVGIFGLALILTLPLLWQVSPKDGVVPFKAHTLAGMAILISRSHELIAALDCCGHEPLKVLEERTKGAYYTSLIHHSQASLYPSFRFQRLKGENDISREAPRRELKVIDWYQPWNLHPVSRIASTLITAGFIIVLTILVQRSIRHDGLGDAPGDNTSHYLWTSLPSALFVGLSAYFGSCDFELRSLAPFALLSSKATTYSEGLTLSFMDQSAVRILFRSMRRRHLVVAFSTCIVLLCSLLPIFTASLFTVKMSSRSHHVSLQQTEWFTADKFELQESNIPDLILNANLSYPQWTFEDLVIPQYQLAKPAASGDLQADSTISTQLRAVRAVLDCHYSTSTGNVSIDVYGRKEICNPSGFAICPMDRSQPFGLDPIDTRWLCNVDNFTAQWPPLMYAWGKCQKDSEEDMWGSDAYATVLICNETFEEVAVQATLFGPDLEIRESHPPIPAGSSGTPVALDFSEVPFEANSPGYNIPDPYQGLVDSKGDARSLFGTLTSSRYAIPHEWLGDTSRNEDVIAALKKVHGIVRAQMLRGSAGAWRNLQETSANASFVTREKLPIQPVDGEVWLTVPRVVQNETATYVLVGLLAVIFVLNALLVWESEVHGYRRAVPKSSGTIVAVASLFANSTFFAHLPANAQWATHQKLEQHFEGAGFRWAGTRRTFRTRGRSSLLALSTAQATKGNRGKALAGSAYEERHELRLSQ